MSRLECFGSWLSVSISTDSAAGGSDDFAKGGAGVKFSYTLELRDAGRYEKPIRRTVPFDMSFSIFTVCYQD